MFDNVKKFLRCFAVQRTLIFTMTKSPFFQLIWVPDFIEHVPAFRKPKIGGVDFVARWCEYSFSSLFGIVEWGHDAAYLAEKMAIVAAEGVDGKSLLLYF